MHTCSKRKRSLSPITSSCIRNNLISFLLEKALKVCGKMKSASVCSLSFFEGRVAAAIAASLRSLIPPLEFSNYKGVMGRVAVIGGSKDYTGAPYYAAEAALKFGADLCYVYCSSDAAIPIKSYSPELMVTPLFDDKIFAMPSSFLEVLNEVSLKTEIHVHLPYIRF